MENTVITMYLGENSVMNYLVSCFFEKHSVVIANIFDY